MQATTDITIRFADCDPMGHTNNAAYFTYFEQARGVLFAHIMGVEPTSPVTPELFPFILAEVSCRFIKPTLANQVVRITATVLSVKNSSFIIEYQISDIRTGEKVADGRSAQVWYDYKAQKSIPIPEKFRKILMAT